MIISGFGVTAAAATVVVVVVDGKVSAFTGGVPLMEITINNKLYFR